MRDFTLKAYENYLELIRKNFSNILTFKEFIPIQASANDFCLIRHDVDRKVINSYNMALLENIMGMKSTYYFRMKKDSFVPEYILKIKELGHEVGYHYENMSDTNGNYEKALEDFKKNLQKFRTVTEVDTISMHGRPLKPYDNRDLWKHKNNHQLLKSELGILGEVYLDIDYSDIAYVGDTGRNWLSDRNNVRDKVSSKITVDLHSPNELRDYLDKKPHSKMVFQIHPERWTDKKLEWQQQKLKDGMINTAKKVLGTIKRK